MAYYYEMEFDENKFLSDLIDNCRDTHEVAVEHALKKADKSVWKDAYVKNIGSQFSEIITDSVKAFIGIYGSGTKMASEIDNPYLDDYISSNLWNPNRKSSDVYYRPIDKTWQIDWKNDTIIEKGNSGKEGIIKNFKAESPHLEKMEEVLKEYKNEFEYYISYYIKVMFDDLSKYTTMKKVVI